MKCEAGTVSERNGRRTQKMASKSVNTLYQLCNLTVDNSTYVWYAVLCVIIKFRQLNQEVI